MTSPLRLGGLFNGARERLLLELDQIEWRRQTAVLRWTGEGTGARNLLICDLMTMVATAKAEALMARSLRREGFFPVVLLGRRNRIIERCYRALGPVEFIYLHEEIAPPDRVAAKDEAARRVAADPDFTSLFQWTPDNCRIGRNVLSLAVRRLRIGRVDPRDPTHRAIVEETLAESLATKVTIERILDRVQPELALFNERGYTPAGEVFDACLLRGIDTVQWFGAPQSDCLCYKRYRLDTRDNHPLSLGDETWAALKNAPWSSDNDARIMEHLGANYASGAWFNRQQLQEGKKIKSREQVLGALGLDPGRKTAAIFSHILYDATFFYGESLFADYEEWLVETVRAAAANRNLNWIVKVHPVNVWRSRMDGQPLTQLEVSALKTAFGELPDHVNILPADTDVNTYSLFSTIDYGLTVRGTIGMELPCFGIPVVTAGSGRYSGKGFTIDPPTREAYRETIAHLHEIERLDADTVRLARLYAFGTFMLRPIRMDTFAIDYAANTYGATALSYNTKLTAGVDEFEHSAHLRRVRDWIRSRAQGDLLNRDVRVPSAALKVSG